jgi:hypothetical protein
MHTSAPTASAAPHSASSDALQLAWQGTLLGSAQARIKPIDGEGHTVPCLCFDIELDNALRNAMHVEQPFPADQYEQAQQAAKALKKGMRVSVQLSALDLRFVARNASAVVISEPEASPQPAAEPDLFA